MQTLTWNMLVAAAVWGLPVLEAAAVPPRPLKIRVENVPREAHVYAPASEEALPVVFVFHGHGGTAQSAAESFGVHEHWPEAICVYMQGLPTPSEQDPQGKRAGWQKAAGEQEDRDLKFFDAVLARLRSRQKLDDARIYATGFSNGGFFTYALWAARGDVLAATAPCGCHAGPSRKDLKAKPCLHIAGQDDDKVSIDVQQKCMEFVRELNGCEATGEPWNKGTRIVATYYTSPSGTPFVSLVCPVGHQVPMVAGRMIVRFFKEQSKP